MGVEAGGPPLPQPRGPSRGRRRDLRLDGADGHGQAVYLEAEVERLEDDEAERCIAVFSHRSQEFGGPTWGVEEISPPAPLRLYRASASAHYVLSQNDERIAVSLG